LTGAVSKWAALAAAVSALVYAVVQQDSTAVGVAFLAVMNWFIHPPTKPAP
jgi:hypothetical protein